MLSAAVIIDALRVMTVQGLDCMRVVKIDKSGFFDKYISKTRFYDLFGLITNMHWNIFASKSF